MTDQLSLLPLEAPPANNKPPPPTPAEKTAQREAQGGKCLQCGGQSKVGGLDVVRLPTGALVAYCRSCRCSWDGVWRARKGAQKRRRRHSRPGRRAGQELLAA